MIMGFFRGFIGMGLDEDMLICLSTLQSYCLLSVFARDVDNLFGEKTLLYINNWRLKVAKSKTYNPIDAFNALNQDSLMAIS